MFQQRKILDAEKDNLSLSLGTTSWEERIACCKLSSDFHMHKTHVPSLLSACVCEHVLLW